MLLSSAFTPRPSTLDLLSDKVKKYYELQHKNALINFKKLILLSKLYRLSKNLSKTIQKELKLTYRTLESYQDFRMFFDYTQKFVSVLEPAVAEESDSVWETPTRHKLEILVKALNLYNQKAKRKLDAFDKPAYYEGDLFKRIKESEAWESRCKQYAILA